jgi:NADH-quinone oxidoreductase subunit C
MEMKLQIENEILDKIKFTFHSAEVRIPRHQRIEVKLRHDLIHPFLGYAKNTLGFKHLSHISCVDWLEDNQIELVYILMNYENLVEVIAKIRLNREKPEIPTLREYWPQIETYEREIHEMYGVDFIGHGNLTDFILEDWEGIPPMRRDFDTVKYSKENFFHREGREDAQDVRTTITKKSGEEIPELAKVYSVRHLE